MKKLILATLIGAFSLLGIDQIINNASKMMTLMGNSPYDFVIHHSESDLKPLEKFVHRTFNGTDFISFIRSLQYIYQSHNGLEAVFSKENPNLQQTISEFKSLFFVSISFSRLKNFSANFSENKL